jgi:peroxiredoxin
MKNAAILVGVALTVAILMIFYLLSQPGGSSSSPSSPPAAPAATARAINDLPDMPLVHVDGTEGTAKEIRGKAILILFQPDCDHCQRETVQIREHLSAFEGYTLYFISNAPPQLLNQFAQEYGLSGQPAVRFAHTSTENILSNYGPIDAPSMFLYSEEGRLLKSFIGETAIENILEHL